MLSWEGKQPKVTSSIASCLTLVHAKYEALGTMHMEIQCGMMHVAMHLTDNIQAEIDQSSLVS